ncbi:MAG TPA: hypothetical protein VLI39_01500 [Sedimentisphaerales bacterium]|nr:hypothetical protein [Sedimentisphaerales bacterium]
MIRRRGIWVVVLAIAVAATARADMIPAFGTVVPASVPASEPLERQSPSVVPEDALFPLGALDPLAGGLPRVVLAGSSEPSPPQPVIILSDEQDSLSLCLYALFSLGLCKSAPWVKRLSFGIIPSWYHDGGPWQIGHSFAVAPDCLSYAEVCVVQPQGAPERLTPDYNRGIVSPLLRNSQFTLAVLAARGPPVTS